MPSHSQRKSKETRQYNVASLDAQQPRENALKGSADYSALILYKRRAGLKLASDTYVANIDANDVTVCTHYWCIL